MTNANREACSEQDVDGRLEFLGIDETSREYIRKAKPIVERELPIALDRFYNKVRNTPEVRKFFSSDDHMNGAKNAQVGHWSAITTGRFDQEYTRRVRTIGDTHARIGLEPRWYIGGYSLILEQLVDAVLKEFWPEGRLFSGRKSGQEEAARVISALIKAVMLDMDFSISVYMDRGREMQQKIREEAVRTMETTVSTLTKAVERLAEKDLSYRIEEDLPEGYAGLKDDFNRALDSLSETIGNILRSAETIQLGSDEIRSAADDLSRRAEQQAAAVEETAAAVEEITATVKSSTERAETAGQLVSRTRRNAEQSGDVVRKAVEAMDRISKSSEDISRIIGVIDEIAFQTNLLALNAGVEAARAGDAGKGFAVVAQEVRELAQRSAAAAKEIKQLITTSGEEVKNGVSLVDETGRALETIVTEVQEIASNVEAIIDSAREQTSGLQEINTSVYSVDSSTQQNAAMSEEMTASSHSLGQEVAAINSMLREFRIGMSQTLNAPAAREPKAPAAPKPQAPRAAAPKPVTEDTPARPRPSPARALGGQVAKAFGASTNAAEDWEEF
ncbi:methyl-accepting chemotaxis protein [Oricola thermophila]|uniref:Globin-coupled sensor protein n=1 Tax=Oricola thermophila TaxID=2742145 RepID=A0A6N1VH35_9HYPH|nr:methyl-accepting chemotaxis protein [Oricola thermophila]QKV18602.1 globin-coupled sensor protein [Oricola thermophila]